VVDRYLPSSIKITGKKPTKNLGIVLVFFGYFFVGCQGQDLSGLFHNKSKHQTEHPSVSATANFISKAVGRVAAALRRQTT
jgi:hypothetical protein